MDWAGNTSILHERAAIHAMRENNELKNDLRFFVQWIMIAQGFFVIYCSISHNKFALNYNCIPYFQIFREELLHSYFRFWCLKKNLNITKSIKNKIILWWIIFIPYSDVDNCERANCRVSRAEKIMMINIRGL